MTDPARPRYHVSPRHGWLNDPYGILWHDGAYRLFWQSNPHAPQWTAGMSWRGASGADLVHWQDDGVVLAPGGGDNGCWSGSVVADGERLAALYTSIGDAGWERGRLALAWSGPDGQPWVKEGLVLAGPPSQVQVTAFRDPFCWRSGDLWHVVVGAGLPDAGGSGAILQFSSRDLREWHYDGIACSRASAERSEAWTGEVWECPQLIEVGGEWVLVVSVWHQHVLHHAAYAVGEYDGAVFTPRRWGRLTYGDALYATGSFRDRDGHAGVLSWIREEGAVPRGRSWAGALSLPHRVELSGGALTAAPHPDVDLLRIGKPRDLAPASEIGAQEELLLRVALPEPDSAVTLAFRQARDPALTLTARATALTVSRPGRADWQMPLHADPGGEAVVRIFLDGSVTELFTGDPGSAGAARVVTTADRWTLAAAATGGARITELSATELECWFPA